MKTETVPLTLENGDKVVLTVETYEPGDPLPNLQITVVDGLTCPRCCVGEIEPGTEHLPFFDYKNPDTPYKKVAIRGFKVDKGDGHGWYSECLHCKEAFGNGWFAEDGTLEQP